MIMYPAPGQFVWFTERGKQWPFLVIGGDAQKRQLDGWVFSDHGTHLYKGVSHSALPDHDQHWQATRVATEPFA